MQADIARLAQEIVDDYHHRKKDTTSEDERRFLVGIAGPPGCGKTTIAYPLTMKINELLQSSTTSAELVDHHLGEGGSSAICVSLDGWHYPRSYLDQMADPVEAHHRRGAAFTFDQAGYHSFLNTLRLPLSKSPETIPFPTFHHAVKDPVPSPIPILPSHRIILIEGLYTLLDTPGWKECSEAMDVRIWVDVQRETARRRLIKRNYEAGIVSSLEECAVRVDAVDMVNGEFVREHSLPPTHTFVSVDVPIAVPVVVTT